MKLLLPLLFLIASSGLFWGYINPTYANIKKLKQEKSLYDNALENSEKLIAVREKLLDQFNSFSSTDKKRLEKILPSHMDNIRLVRDIDGIAARYGMSLNNVKIDVAAKEDKAEIETDAKKYRSVNLDFSVSSSYKTFLRFLSDLESSLRIVDITDVDFQSSEGDFYEFNISIQTYWLK